MKFAPKLFVLLLFLLTNVLSACNTNPSPVAKPPESNTNTAAALPSDAQVAKLDTTDQALIKNLARAYYLYKNHSKSIWSEKTRFDQVPLLLVRKGLKDEAQYAYLINYPNPESLPGAKQVTLPAGIVLPPVYRLDNIPNAERLKNVAFFDYFYPINDKDVFMMYYIAESAENPSLVPTSFQWIRYFTHEVLHKLQVENWKTQMGKQGAADYPLVQENVAMMMVENKIILDALSAKTSQDLKEKIQQFLAVRAERIKKWPAVAELDNSLELNEGTARYIEYRLDDIAGEINQNPVNREISAIFSIPPNNIRGYLMFGRYYSLGAALCELLDRLGSDWKPQLEAGKTPYDILSSQISVTDSSGILERARKFYDFSTLLEKADQTVSNMGKAGSDPYTPSSGVEPGETKVVQKNIQKPYQMAAPELLPSYIPESFKLMGSFKYAVSEHQIPELGKMYSPAASDVTVIDYQKGTEMLRISRAPYPGGTLKSWKAQNVIGMPGAKITTIAGVEVQTFEVTGPNGLYSSVTFVLKDELITIEGPVVLDEMQKIVVSILGK